MVVVFHLRALEDLESHRLEDRFDLFPDERQRMTPPEGQLAARQCHVDTACWPSAGLERFPALGERRVDLAFEDVGGFAQGGPVGRRGPRHRFHERRDLALFTSEIPISNGLQVLRGRDGVQVSLKCHADGVDGGLGGHGTALRDRRFEDASGLRVSV